MSAGSPEMALQQISTKPFLQSMWTLGGSQQGTFSEMKVHLKALSTLPVKYDWGVTTVKPL